MATVHILPIENNSPLENEEGVLFNSDLIPTRRWRGITDIAGAEVRYTYELPEEVRDEVPLLIINGYGAVKSAYHRLRHYVATSGKPAITFRPPRSQSWFKGWHPTHLLQPAKLQSQAAWAVMRDIGESTGQEQFDLLGHSMGGQTAANTAEKHPDKVRSIIFEGSAGLDGHNLQVMQERIKAFLSEELAPALGRLAIDNHPKIALGTAHYILRNIGRTLGEGISVANCDIRGKVVHLGQLGIKTAALQFPADRLFPLQGVIENSANIFDVFRVYHNPNAGHLTPQLEPENVARASLKIIQELHGSVARA